MLQRGGGEGLQFHLPPEADAGLDAKRSSSKRGMTPEVRHCDERSTSAANHHRLLICAFRRDVPLERAHRAVSGGVVGALMGDGHVPIQTAHCGGRGGVVGP